MILAVVAVVIVIVVVVVVVVIIISFPFGVCVQPVCSEKIPIPGPHGRHEFICCAMLDSASLYMCQEKEAAEGWGCGSRAVGKLEMPKLPNPEPKPQTPNSNSASIIIPRLRV